jgi:hypothetical protein
MDNKLTDSDIACLLKGIITTLEADRRLFTALGCFDSYIKGLEHSIKIANKILSNYEPGGNYESF